MSVLTLKERFFLLLGVVLLYIPLSFSSLYVTFDGLSSYFSFPAVFVFSSLIIYGFLGGLVFISLVFISIPPIFLGRKSSDSVQKIIGKFILYCFYASVVSQLVFRFYFINVLEQKNYIACQGIPSGWMPGMATKYALNKELCVN